MRSRLWLPSPMTQFRMKDKGSLTQRRRKEKTVRRLEEEKACPGVSFFSPPLSYGAQIKNTFRMQTSRKATRWYGQSNSLVRILTTTLRRNAKTEIRNLSSSLSVSLLDTFTVFSGFPPHSGTMCIFVWNIYTRPSYKGIRVYLSMKRIVHALAFALSF